MAKIDHATCELAVPPARSYLVTYTLRDDVLQALVERGYKPYHTVGVPRTGMYLDWGLETQDHWFHGKQTVYRAALKEKTGNRTFHLGKAPDATRGVPVRGLPRCNVR